MRRRSPRLLAALAGALLLLLAGCGGMRGAQTLELRHEARLRSAHVLLGEGGGKGGPLLLLLHGGAGSGEGLARHLRELLPKVVARGWSVALPDGVGRSWNDGRADTDAEAIRLGVDDVGFLRALVQRLVAAHGFDPRRVYVAGISNGGFMAQRLACEAADVFAGAASVTATRSVDLAARCTPSRPIAVALLNGTDDPIVPYDGGAVRLFGKTRGAITSTEATLAFWRAHNGCSEAHEQRQHRPADVQDPTSATSSVWRSCTGAPVGLVRVLAGGHAWPGAPQYLPQSIIGRASGALDGLGWIVDFFEAAARN
jgi:polyhydroxybutyrate depolymerase